MRRRLSPVVSLEPAAGVGDTETGSSGSLLTDLKLFGLTYAAGFLFVSLFIA